MNSPKHLELDIKKNAITNVLLTLWFAYTSMFTVCSTESQFTVTAIGVQFIFRNTVGTVLARIAFTWGLICQRRNTGKE